MPGSKKTSERPGDMSPDSSPLRPLPSSPERPGSDTDGDDNTSEASSRVQFSSPGSVRRRSPISSTSFRPHSAASGRVNTPVRRRPDTNSAADHHHRIVVDRPQNLEANATDTPARRAPGARVYIWGTRICVEEVQTTMRRFLETYTEPAPAEDELMLAEGFEEREVDPSQPFYLQRLRQIAHTEEPHLNVNLQHMLSFDVQLYRRIVCYPADVIPYLDLVVNNVFFDMFPDVELPYQIEIRPFNAEKTRNMRSLDPEDIDQLITVTGMVIRTSPLIPEMRQGFFQCSICRNTKEVEVDRGRIEEPTVCTNCSNNHCFQLIHNRSDFMDKQIVKLQEAPDDMPAGQTPHTVTLIAHGNLVDSVQPGDRVTVTGIFRAFPLRSNPRMRTVKAVYKTHIDVLHFRTSADLQRLHQGGDDSRLSAERIQLIKDLSQKPDIYQRLAHALAPSIYEHEDIKKGILCLLFGGTRKDMIGQGRTRFRSEINLLLCGDPGTSKSQLLQYVRNLVPRAQYTSGKGSSAVGLTAYVTRDPETKHFVLQTGALVLSDNGVCCIDEFDKMNDSTRAVLHEVMEQQTLSIAKAGIICQLNARASVLAAANPVDSQWNKDKTIIENVQLPHTLLSRFDLIFLLVDPQDEFYDRRLATHLVSLYYKTKETETAEFLDMSLIRDYVAYAKEHVNPELSEEASQCLVEKYLQMRKVGSGKGQVSAFPRQLESLIRLAEAHAKIRLAETVLESDVEEAYRLHREALKQSAVDPMTGRVDVNILAAGMSSTTRKHILELADIVKRTLAHKPPGTLFSLKKLLHDLRQDSDRLITREIFDDAVADLTKNEVIGRTGDRIRLIRQL